MIEATVTAHPGPNGMLFTVWISPFNSKAAISDTPLRESLSRRAADDLYNYMMEYLDSPEGREVVWNLGNSTGAPAPSQ